MEFKLWKTIRVGEFKSGIEIEDALVESGFKIGSWAKTVLWSNKFYCFDRCQRISLTRMTVGQLGFNEGTNFSQIISVAKKYNLRPCPPEVGAQIRLQYLDQPKLEQIFIYTRIFNDQFNHRGLFRVVHSADGKLWLTGDHRHIDGRWNEDDIIVFELPRK